MHPPKMCFVLIAIGLVIAPAAIESQDGTAAQKPAPPLLRDYLAFSVTAPPPALALDPFYKKYVDAHGIPVATSEKVPDAALLMARDIVQFMLANRSDLRRELIRKKWKLAQDAGQRLRGKSASTSASEVTAQSATSAVEMSTVRYPRT